MVDPFDYYTNSQEGKDRILQICATIGRYALKMIQKDKRVIKILSALENDGVKGRLNITVTMDLFDDTAAVYKPVPILTVEDKKMLDDLGVSWEDEDDISG